MPPAKNPGVRLGTALGVLASRGRDKLTLVSSPQLGALGGWLEQLIAESTGKQGKGIIPVDGEELTSADTYGDDRVFAFFKIAGEDTEALDRQLDALKTAGHPVLSFELADALDIVQEMFRWEVATATAAHIMGMNPFDQPNVQESKDHTKDLLLQHKTEGALPFGPWPGGAVPVQGNGAVGYGAASRQVPKHG